MLWHHDPCKDGTDDSCGRFPRARHGDQKTLERIKSGIAFEWKNLFSDTGDPLMSTPGITLNLFWWGALEFFKHDQKKAKRWMRKNLFDILMFAENPIDGLHDAITGKYGQDKEPKSQRISQFAHCIHGWLIRSVRPWWKHPRWHVHHWRLTCRPFWRHWLRKKRPSLSTNTKGGRSE